MQHLAPSPGARLGPWVFARLVLPMLVLAMLVLACRPAAAVTPVSPGFTPETRARVLHALDSVRVPSVGQNSVAIAMLSALGTKPTGTTVEYDEPYPHLPKVDVTSSVRADGCVGVSAAVRGAVEAGYRQVRVTGTFCMVAHAQWASTDVQAVAATAP